MPVYQDGTFPFGSLAAGKKPPTLIDVPAGATVKLRFNQRDVWRAFVRHSNGMFSAWYVEWADREANTIRLWYPFAQTVRQKG